MRTKSGQEVDITREEDTMSTASIIKKKKITIGTSEEDTPAERERTQAAEEERTPQWNIRVMDPSRTKKLLRFRQTASLTRLV